MVIVETGTREKICHAVRRYAKTNNKYIKDYGKIKDCHILNNLYGWVMSQKLPVNTFQQIKVNSKFNEDFMKSYNDESHEGYFLEVDL